MGSGGDKMNEGTSYQPSEPIPCANGCGFFGTPATMNLCSKCYRDFRMKEEHAAAAKVALEKLVTPQDKASSSSAAAAAAIDVKPSSSSSPDSAKQVERQAEEAATDGGVNKKGSNRCSCCNKKVGVTGFTCRCGITFCGVHRYPEKHGCTFDFKGQGREAIAKANPVVKGDKIQRF